MLKAMPKACERIQYKDSPQMQSKAAFPVKKAACIDEDIRRFPDKSTG